MQTETSGIASAAMFVLATIPCKQQISMDDTHSALTLGVARMLLCGQSRPWLRRCGDLRPTSDSDRPRFEPGCRPAVGRTQQYGATR